MKTSPFRLIKVELSMYIERFRVVRYFKCFNLSFRKWNERNELYTAVCVYYIKFGIFVYKSCETVDGLVSVWFVYAYSCLRCLLRSKQRIEWHDEIVDVIQLARTYILLFEAIYLRFTFSF